MHTERFSESCRINRYQIIFTISPNRIPLVQNPSENSKSNLIPVNMTRFRIPRTGIITAIRRTAVWESGISRHQGTHLRPPWNPSNIRLICRWVHSDCAEWCKAFGQPKAFRQFFPGRIFYWIFSTNFGSRMFNFPPQQIYFWYLVTVFPLFLESILICINKIYNKNIT